MCNYIIIVANSLEELSLKVNNKIESEQFVPLGSFVAIAFNYGQPVRFAQNMMKSILIKGEI